MSALTITVATLGEGGLEVDSEVEGSALAPPDTGALGLGIVRIRGRLTPMDGEYLFQGSIAATFHGSCDRCLKPISSDHELDALWTFIQGARAADEDEADGIDADDTATYFAGPDLDLGARAWERACARRAVEDDL